MTTLGHSQQPDAERLGRLRQRCQGHARVVRIEEPVNDGATGARPSPARLGSSLGASSPVRPWRLAHATGRWNLTAAKCYRRSSTMVRSSKSRFLLRC